MHNSKSVMISGGNILWRQPNLPGGAAIEYHGRQCPRNTNVSIVYPSQKHREYYLASMPVGILMTVNLGFSMVTGYR